ncbi:UPF0389 protein GA21628-like [Nylanderia fulva]|uniref:UPF0389 protein GA21628-like n=1 Tax=Nylanderia fulva TaxID=613905 RepID=UPI0010FAD608|nr:UPF0389 protein GA21628-like [Nylanderia fulva]XP_029171728.1 UPF0389 protein GA21628-like [Nylanderia fulva]
MLLKNIIYSAKMHTKARWFTHSSILQETNKTDKISEQKTNKKIKEIDSVLGSRMHRVTNFDKRVLVWVKRYPSIADVPVDVTVECLLAARSKARIKACNYMIVATLIGCIGAVILGKRQAARGETLTKQREDWFKEMLAEEKKE